VAHSVIRAANILSTSAGLGLAGIGAADIEAKGEVYDVERVRDFSGAYIRAAQYTGTRQIRVILYAKRDPFCATTGERLTRATLAFC
jgi:hypothetical protein